VKKIGRWQGAGLLATTLLGTSVFILPQLTYQIASSDALWVWILLTLSIVPVTVIFAKLAGQFPHAAGPAFFVEKAFGATLGKSIGFIFLLIVPLGVPAAVLMTVSFVDAIFNLDKQQQLIASLLMLVILFMMNLKGIQISAKVQFGITMSIVLVVLALIISSGLAPAKNSLTVITTPTDLSPILVAAGVAFWSFIGVEAMTHLSPEFEDPKKDMLPAMLFGTLIVGIIYLACTYLIVINPNDGSIAMVPIFDKFLGGYGSYIIGGLGIAGGISTTNVYTASATRLMASFAESGTLPHRLAQKNTHGVPVTALAIILLTMSCTLIISAVLGQDLEDLISWVNGVFVIIYLGSMLAALKLLPNKNSMTIVFGIVFCFVLAFGLGSDMLYAGLLFVLAIIMIHWQKKRKTGLTSTA